MGFTSARQLMQNTKARQDAQMAFTKYFAKLQEARSDKNAFNPTVVQTKPEFDSMLEDIATRAPITLHTVHLPPGYTMQDVALRNKEFKIVKKSMRKLPKGEMPELPAVTMLADMNSTLTPPQWHIPGVFKDQRIQVIAPEYLPVAEYNGEVLTQLGRPERLTGQCEPESHYSPTEIPDYSVPHRRVSLSVQQRADEVLMTEKMRLGYF